MNLICDNCLKDTGVSVGTSRGSDAVKVRQAGGVVKTDVLYASVVNKSSSWLIYCSEACKDQHYPKHLGSLGLPDEARKRIDAGLEEVRNNIPQMAKETGEALNEFRDKLLEARHKELNKNLKWGKMLDKMIEDKKLINQWLDNPTEENKAKIAHIKFVKPF